MITATHHRTAEIRTVVLSIVCSGLIVGMWGCADVSNRADVYEEVVTASGLPANRTHAFRLTVFEYSHHVGGFIEFYEIDGERNTVQNPYFSPSACAYFGSGRLENDQFPVEAPGPEGRFVLSVDRIDRGRRLVGRLLQDGGAWSADGEPESLTFERTSLTAGRHCPEGVAAYEGSGTGTL